MNGTDLGRKGEVWSEFVCMTQRGGLRAYAFYARGVVDMLKQVALTQEKVDSALTLIAPPDNSSGRKFTGVMKDGPGASIILCSELAELRTYLSVERQHVPSNEVIASWEAICALIEELCMLADTEL